jgi:hypothetical protein
MFLCAPMFHKTTTTRSFSTNIQNVQRKWQYWSTALHSDRNTGFNWRLVLRRPSSRAWPFYHAPSWPERLTLPWQHQRPVRRLKQQALHRPWGRRQQTHSETAKRPTNSAAISLFMEIPFR